QRRRRRACYGFRVRAGWLRRSRGGVLPAPGRRQSCWFGTAVRLQTSCLRSQNAKRCLGKNANDSRRAQRKYTLFSSLLFLKGFPVSAGDGPRFLNPASDTAFQNGTFPVPGGTYTISTVRAERTDAKFCPATTGLRRALTRSQLHAEDLCPKFKPSPRPARNDASP